jgi:hypothetical protein
MAGKEKPALGQNRGAQESLENEAEMGKNLRWTSRNFHVSIILKLSK